MNPYPSGNITSNWKELKKKVTIRLVQEITLTNPLDVLLYNDLPILYKI